MYDPQDERNRIVITGIGLAAPNGNNLQEFRANLLAGVSGVVPYETRYMPPVLAGVCNCDVLRYQKRKKMSAGNPCWLSRCLLCQ
ncbi:MAG: beta-ketoacyl synthase N-terminal-like domain-containing protein [Planctomycetaceae bacterium]